MTQHRQYFDQDRGNGRRNSFRPGKVCCIISLSVALCFAQLSPVLARRLFRNPVVSGNTPSRVARLVAPIRRPVPIGKVLRALPLGYAAIMLSNSRYYYHAGSFYRQGSEGYIVVGAPVGAVISALPVDYSFLYIDEIRYYIHAGNYYLQVSNGYQVVPDPRRTVSQPVISNKVVVTSTILNVRSGPGLQYYIANKANHGDILLVIQRNVDWAYVQLSDNSRGWVLMRFTALASQRADG